MSWAGTGGLLALALAAVVAAQIRAGPTMDAGAVKGRVTDLVGQPLVGAMVAAIPEKSDSALPDVGTDDSGEFELTAPPGRYYIMASARGYRSAAYGEREGVIVGVPVTVDSGRPVVLTLRLARLASVEGRITGPMGEPWEGANIALSQYVRTSAGATLVAKFHGSSIAGGDYRIADVTPGRYYFSATYRNAAVPGGGGMPPRYYPGTDQIERATSLMIDPSARIAVDLQLKRELAWCISGRVVDADGLPQSGARLTAVRYPCTEGPRSVDLQSSRSKPDGTFAFTNMTAGRYFLSAHDARQRIGAIEVDVFDRDIIGKKLVLGDGAKLAGRVMVEGGSAADFSRASVEIVRAPGLPNLLGGGNAVRATVRRDGTFLFSAIPEGYGILLARVDSDFYLKSVRVADAEIGGQPVFFRNGAEWNDGRIVFGRAAECRASVRSDDAPIASAALLLFSRDRALRRTDPRVFYRAWTGPEGSGVLRGVLPGRYTLCGVADPDVSSLADPVTLDRIEDSCKTLELSGGEVRTESLPPYMMR